MRSQQRTGRVNAQLAVPDYKRMQLKPGVMNVLREHIQLVMDLAWHVPMARIPLIPVLLDAMNADVVFSR